MSMFHALLVLCVSGKALAFMVQPGPCPSVKTMDDFNMTQYIGTWYVFAKLRVPNTDILQKCIKSEYSFDDSGTFQEIESYMDRKEGWKLSRLFTYSVPNPAALGRLIRKSVAHRDGFIEEVLSTDYVTYAVLYACDNAKKDHEIHSYIYTRQKNPAKSVIEKAIGILEKYQLPKAGFREVKQTECNMRPDKKWNS